MIRVYGREECAGCKYTTKFLHENGFAFTYFDLDKADDPEIARAHEELAAKGITEIPYVITDTQGSWTGYRRERLKGLVK